MARQELNETVFSEYEVRAMNFLLDGDVYSIVKCVGSLDEEAEVLKVEKKCRGVVSKTRTHGTGSGTLSLTAHIPMQLYYKIHAMEDDSLATGVYAYGRTSIHPEFCVTADVFDEDDNEKLRAWPKCTVTTGPTRNTENGSEEVAEVDLDISFAPDDYDIGIYEAVVDEVNKDIAEAWMINFEPSLVRSA